MITFPEIVNNRKILYLDIKNNLKELETINLTNWAVFVIEDNPENPILPAFASLCIEKDLLYMTATGKACSEVDDIFDEAIVELEINEGKLPSWMKSDEDALMTTWNYVFEDGFWFITSVATYGDYPIDTILVANITSINHLPKIKELAIKISKGWLPAMKD